MRREDIRAMAIESGLDPDLCGYQRAFEQFVEMLESSLKKEHAGICKRMALQATEESNVCPSSYTRTVLRAQARSLRYASRAIEKKSPPF
jgi:hypothetical protein